VLLRHGETARTAEGRFSGSGGPDLALSPYGRWQAEQTAKARELTGVAAVVSSPLARCQETAALVAAPRRLAVEVLDDLREADFGAWDGLTFAEAGQRYPAELAAWLASPNAAPPGGESFAQVTARVRGARSRLLAAYRGRTVLVVSHATPVRTLLRLALGAPHRTLQRIETAPASLSAVAHYADGNATVRYANLTTHLR
jgi:probable phosphoglycerate mutase